MHIRYFCIISLMILFPAWAYSALTRTMISPTRIVWISDSTGQYVMQPEVLMKDFTGQISVADNNCTVMRSTNNHQAAVLLDFGKELHGGIKISSGMRPNSQPLKMRVRFGESVSEAMSDVTPSNNNHSATNDHAMRDFEIMVPWLGSIECGNSGFRFVRLDLLDQDVDYLLRNVQATCLMMDDPEIGTFR